jgi:hypothetical protein
MLGPILTYSLEVSNSKGQSDNLVCTRAQAPWQSKACLKVSKALLKGDSVTVKRPWYNQSREQ